jgi:hypothetical protein
MTAPPANPPGIRLSIAHLMLWTLGSAIILACFRAMSSRQEELPDAVLRLQPFYHLGYSLTLGAQFGSVLLFAARRIRGLGGFPAQPGHWLLLVEGVSAILILGGYGLYLLQEGPEGHSMFSYFVWQLPNLAACTFGYILAFTRTERGSPWRYGLGIAGLIHGLQLFLVALSAWTFFLIVNGSSWYSDWELPPNGVGLALAITVLLASLADWKRHAERDILHWAGIATFVGNVALQLVYQMILVSF